jgi:hypothetical protein
MAGGIDYEARDGRVVLAAFIPERYGAAGSVIPLGDDSAAAAAAAAVKRPPPGPLEFKSSNGDEATDAAFLQQLRQYAAAEAGGSAGAGDGDSTEHLGAERLKQLRLASVDVAKLTTQGVSCLAFHPNSGSRPIIAAADKSGKVGEAVRGLVQEGGGGVRCHISVRISFCKHSFEVGVGLWEELGRHMGVPAAVDYAAVSLITQCMSW